MADEQTEMLISNDMVKDEEQKSLGTNSTTSVPEAAASGSLQKVEKQIIGGFEVRVEVHRVGDFEVVKKEKIVSEGEPAKTATLVTFHDIGLNHDSFNEFLNQSYNLQFYDKLILYHINTPGQETGADEFSQGYDFPTLPVLAVKLHHVLEHFKLTDLIGLGIGAGANVLMHLAIEASDRFLGIALVDPSAQPPGFKEWGEEKLAAWQLDKKGFTTTAQKFLIWHLFGTSKNVSKPVNLEMIDRYIRQMKQDINPHNLSAFVKSYMNRTNIMSELKDKLKCRVLIITSEFSPYKGPGQSIHTEMSKHRLATKGQEVEIMIGQGSINIFFEDPEKCGEALLALMQGCGIVPTLRSRSASRGGPMHRTASMCEEDAA